MRKKAKSGPPEYSEYKMKSDVLKAWKGGERTIDEVVKITGYTRKQVRYYLPETRNG